MSWLDQARRGSEISHAPGRGGDQFIPRPPTVEPGDPPPWSSVPPGERHLDLASLVAALAAAPRPRPSPVEQAGVRPSAVLAPLYEHEGELHIVLTRRAWHLRSHSGEVSFPGGAVEDGEDLVEAALREALEEVALDPASVTIVGELDHLQTYTSQSFIVPFVGVLPGRPELRPNLAEVDEVLHVPVAELLLDEVYREERWGLVPLDRPLIFFELVGDTVWGATAHMLRNLLAIGTGTAWRR